MNTYRTRRPLLVKATQCTQPTSVVTDLGKRQVRPGDWIIEGEGHEQYVVDDAFFQRTFAPIPWEPLEEGQHYAAKHTSMRTRSARLEDAYSIYRLVDEFSHDGTLLHRAYAEVCRNIRTFTVVESDAGEFFGCAALHVYGPHLAEIRSIVVRPAIRRNGAGGLLVESLLAEAEQNSIRCVCLFTRVPTFFEHFRFRVTEHGALRDKVVKDCLRCTRRLACDETPMVVGELPVQQCVNDSLPIVGSTHLVQLHIQPARNHLLNSDQEMYTKMP